MGRRLPAMQLSPWQHTELRFCKRQLRAPAQAGHDSGVMADTFPATWRTAFRREAGRFAVAPGMLSAVPGTVSGMAPE